VDLSLVEGGLLDLDLLVEYLEFLISLDQLSAKNVALVNHHFIILTLFLLFLLRLSYHIFESSDVALLGADHLLTGVDLLADLLDISLELGILSGVLLLLLRLVVKLHVLTLNLLLQLRYLLGHSLELEFQLRNFFLRLQQVLGVEVAI
jgi:hypothetical protein